jgi:hypothetical protein
MYYSANVLIWLTLAPHLSASERLKTLYPIASGCRACRDRAGGHYALGL